jgi:murein DD-endopeptidase MepM/ murein hydrolase activator NlpD
LPDKDGSFKFEVDEGINYGVKFDNLLYRYVTPSNADLSTIYDFKLKIDPDNLEVNFPITVGPHTWPTRFTGNQDSCGNTAQKGERCVEAYQDISKGFNGAPYGGAVRDWMDGHNVIDNHWGTDINIDAGTPELASAPGKVIETVENWPNQQGSFFYGFYSDADAKVLYQDSGKLVCIDHDVIDSSSGYHLYTMSTHLNGVSVKVGDFVKRGQQIGTCGTTGRTYNHPENDFIQFGSKNGSLWAPDMYAYRGDPNSISYWTKKSNPQQPNDPQSPIPD